MGDLDRETQAAIEALVYRLKNRTDEDDEPFAQEYVMAMRARGWRPTEARYAVGLPAACRMGMARRRRRRPRRSWRKPGGISMRSSPGSMRPGGG